MLYKPNYLLALIAACGAISKRGNYLTNVKTNKPIASNAKPPMNAIKVTQCPKYCFINAITVTALCAFEEICEKLGKSNPYVGIKEEISAKVNDTFYNPESGFYFVMSPDEKPSELVNSLCVVSGICDEEKSKFICEKLVSGELAECSLSMKPFKYDALLVTDKKYRENCFHKVKTMIKYSRGEKLCIIIRWKKAYFWPGPIVSSPMWRWRDGGRSAM